MLARDLLLRLVLDEVAIGDVRDLLRRQLLQAPPLVLGTRVLLCLLSGP